MMADDLPPFATKISAGAVMTSFGFRVYSGPTLEGSTIHNIANSAKKSKSKKILFIVGTL